MNPSARLARVPPFPFARWAASCHAAEARGIDLIRLDIGNPDLPPPPAVIEAATRAVRRPTEHGYPGYRGSETLRHAICSYYQRRFGVSLDPDAQVSCLLGSKEGIVHLQQAILDPGDVVLVPDPGYAPYCGGAGLAQANTIRFPLSESNERQPVFEAIPEEVAQRATLVWLNYPNNPTGAVGTAELFERAVRFARCFDLLLCHDAPYTEVRFDGCRPGSILQVPGAAEVAVEFNSLSKAYNMPGWRVGYAVGNPDALDLLRRIKSNLDSGMFLPLQHAAVAALETDDAWIEERNAVYRERLELIAEVLCTIGLPVRVPRATHYLWIGLPEGQSAERFALRLLDETGIALAPGTFFGPGGEGHVRLSVTVSSERVREAAERLSSWRPMS